MRGVGALGTQRGRGSAGVLRIAYTRSGADLRLGKLVRSFRTRYPRYRIEALTGWTSWNLELLQDRTVDAAFIRGLERPRGVEVLELGAEDMVVALPVGHRLAEREAVQVAELAEEPVVLESGVREQPVARMDDAANATAAKLAPCSVLRLGGDEQRLVVALPPLAIGVRHRVVGALECTEEMRFHRLRIVVLLGSLRVEASSARRYRPLMLPVEDVAIRVRFAFSDVPHMLSEPDLEIGGLADVEDGRLTLRVAQRGSVVYEEDVRTRLPERLAAGLREGRRTE
ncbi:MULTISPECIES: LysR substrate-binding domain-containing protein [unclassified Streptomyces]|uniref:LysR substrate-binding domain-containing protein n=1 Tax=unclassified Streptomyces TaxID=2593676 RepID=UPI0037F6E78A